MRSDNARTALDLRVKMILLEHNCIHIAIGDSQSKILTPVENIAAILAAQKQAIEILQTTQRVHQGSIEVSNAKNSNLDGLKDKVNDMDANLIKLESFRYTQIDVCIFHLQRPKYLIHYTESEFLWPFPMYNSSMEKFNRTLMIRFSRTFRHWKLSSSIN
jgi:hypothetical protein